MTSFNNFIKSSSDFFSLLNKTYPSKFDRLFYSTYFIRWLKYTSIEKSALKDHVPWVVFEAESFLRKFLNKDSIVFEFGSGGSSIYFSKLAKKTISVEHDKIWFDMVLSEVKQQSIENWQGFLEVPDIVNEAEFLNLDFSDPNNYKSSDSNLKNCSFKNYAKKILNYEDNYFDVVFIDGRARPSCLVHSYSKVKTGGILVLDNSERAYYLSKTKPELFGFTLLKEMHGPGPFYKGFWQTTIWIKK